METINSYPEVYAIGHKVIHDLFDGEVLVEEKIDGSQFSMGVVNGELCCRSKGKQIILDAPEKMFTKAIETALELKDELHPEWVYRCEFLQKPKHNVLLYDRVPRKNLILYDIMVGVEDYGSYVLKESESLRLGIDCVPLLYFGRLSELGVLNGLLETISILGGTLIEGVVVKNYDLFTQQKKYAIGKYVSEKFKEVADGDWKRRNPSQNDLLQQLIVRYRTEARWSKAVQHLEERGELLGEPKDIGSLMKEVAIDTKKECEDEIKDILFRHYWKKIQRGITGGLADWYKEELAKQAFEEDDDILVPEVNNSIYIDERYTLKEALSIKPLKSNLRERDWRMIWIRFKTLPDSIVYVLKTGIILSEKQRRK